MLPDAVAAPLYVRSADRHGLGPVRTYERASSGSPRRLSEVNDTGITVTRSEYEPGDSDGKRETPWARAAWVEEENTLTLLEERPVGVTGKDRREPSSRGLEAELLDVMNHVEGMRPDFDHLIGGKLRSPCTLVVIAPDSANGGDSPKRVENCERADVSTMHDEITSAELLDRLGPDEAVRVGDHANHVPGRLRTQGVQPTSLSLALPSFGCIELRRREPSHGYAAIVKAEARRSKSRLPCAMRLPSQSTWLRSDGRRRRRAQEEIGADTPFVGLIFPRAICYGCITLPLGRTMAHPHVQYEPTTPPS